MSVGIAAAYRTCSACKTSSLIVKSVSCLHGGGGGGGCNGEIANLSDEKSKFAITIFRHW